MRRALLCLVAAGAVVSASVRASAQVSEPEPRPNEQFDFMNLLSQHHMHDLDDEWWNAYGQFTYISAWKQAFSARYTDLGGANSSLGTSLDRSWTASATLYVAARLWKGGEAYVVPEVIAEQPLSGLKGLAGAIQNFELQKTGSANPQVYRARAYLQQTFGLGGGLGGGRESLTSDPMQLGARVDKRRIVVRVGNFSVVDFLDKNTFSGDLRQQFFNMAFLTYAAYDFVADARGYSWGAEAELDFGDVAIHVARMAPPLVPNGLPLTFRLDRYYGDQIEVEHDHTILGRDGAVRVLAYRNRENMGRFEDAVAAFKADPTKNAAGCGDGRYNYGSTNANAPDLCWVRRDNTKVGVGLNVEQHLTDDIGIFFRGMISDGRTEVYSFTSTDRSVSFGALAHGSLWHRGADVTGLGAGIGWASHDHADYLRAGGVDGFIGDGALRAGAESVIEAFYSMNVMSSVWVSGDYQHIANPAFNADRGPVDVFGARIHAEF